ncbi:MAG: guanylate kinase [Lachnospiraceae bacterium]|nr:guanylate kinase [Lachnospiraceae bacterium]
MGKIFYIFGKSSAGKDTIYKRLLEDKELDLKRLLLYTTRPKREGEKEGVSYHFTDEESYARLEKEGRIIESRAYDTIHGIWRYFTLEDEDMDLNKNSYLITGVLESFISTRDYFGEDRVLPIYVEVDDGIRLQRALNREKRPENRRFAEMCRRFLSDSRDFSEDKLKAAGIDRSFVNEDFESCISEIKDYIRAQL